MVSIMPVFLRDSLGEAGVEGRRVLNLIICNLCVRFLMNETNRRTEFQIPDLMTVCNQEHPASDSKRSSNLQKKYDC